MSQNNEPVNINIPMTREQTTSINMNDNICNEILKKHIIMQIKNLLYWREKWKIIGLSFTILKYICFVSTPILSLSSTQTILYEYQNLFAYLSGVVASLGLGFEKLEKLSRSISINKNEELKKYLNEFKINFEINNCDIKTDEIMTPRTK